ncbi:MAG TPA: FmdB family zinc ribbon protein [Mycobacteriales bacterium]|nr:FmdB family zinc ribbon protein [Mycobacteriales bacterium]
MPTYEYACTECGERLEVVQSFSDDPLTICPSCEGKLRKVFSPVGVVFKGSGFYKTDSRSGSGAKTGTSSEPAKTAAKDGTSGSSGSSESSSAGTGGSTSTTTSSNTSSSGSGSPKSGSKDGSKVA